MRIQHGAAARDIANKQNCKNAEQKQCRPQLSRSEIKPGVNEVNRDATQKHAPAAAITPVPIDKRSKTEGKHISQDQQAGVRTSREKRG